MAAVPSKTGSCVQGYMCRVHMHGQMGVDWLWARSGGVLACGHLSSPTARQAGIVLVQCTPCTSPLPQSCFRPCCTPRWRCFVPRCLNYFTDAPCLLYYARKKHWVVCVLGLLVGGRARHSSSSFPFGREDILFSKLLKV